MTASCVVAAGGCVTSYRAAPPLAFENIPYESLDHKSWPTKHVGLPGIAKDYALPTEPRVAYVELNPESERSVVFIHGLGSYLKFWQYQIDEFARSGYRVIAVDMLGYGKSDKPALFPYTMEAMADVVHELATKLDLQSPVLVGHSMGGQTALAYAIRYPDEVGALVLTSPAGFETFSRKEVAWFKSVFSVALIKGTPEEGIWGTVRQNNFQHWRPELEWLIEERVRVVGSKDFDDYAYANVKSVHGLANNSFVRENLRSVDAPVLIIHGDSDRLIPNPFLHGGSTVEIMEFGHSHIRGSKLVTLATCGHTVQMDCPDAYNKEVLGFLEASRAAIAARAKGTKDQPEGDSPEPAPRGASNGTAKKRTGAPRASSR